MKLFKGQKVHVLARVDNPEPDDEGDIRLIMQDDWAAYVKPESIIHVEPMPLAVGDLVTWGSGGINYVIRFIDGAAVFLKRDDIDYYTVHQDISHLRRVET